MMGRTHALAGITTVWLLQGVPAWRSAEAVALLSLFTALGSLLPDLDATDSLIKRTSVAGVMPFAPLAWLINRSFGHRGLLHSLLGWSLASLLFLLLGGLFLMWLSGGTGPFGTGAWGTEPLGSVWPETVPHQTVPLALSLGYASHLATDACTKSGIPFLYPRRQRYHLLPRLLRVTTGSAAEEVVFIALAVCVAALLLRLLLAPALFFSAWEPSL